MCHLARGAAHRGGTKPRSPSRRRPRGPGWSLHSTSSRQGQDKRGFRRSATISNICYVHVCLDKIDTWTDGPFKGFTANAQCYLNAGVPQAPARLRNRDGRIRKAPGGPERLCHNHEQLLAQQQRMFISNVYLVLQCIFLSTSQQSNLFAESITFIYTYGLFVTSQVPAPLPAPA